MKTTTARKFQDYKQGDASKKTSKFVQRNISSYNFWTSNGRKGKKKRAQKTVAVAVKKKG